MVTRAILDAKPDDGVADHHAVRNDDFASLGVTQEGVAQGHQLDRGGRETKWRGQLHAVAHPNRAIQHE